MCPVGGHIHFAHLFSIESTITPHSTPTKVRSDVIDKGCRGEHDVSVGISSQEWKLLIGPKREKTAGRLLPSWKRIPYIFSVRDRNVLILDVSSFLR